MWGYDHRVCYDGTSALQTALDYRPDCVLLDLSMPGMDGYTMSSGCEGKVCLHRFAAPSRLRLARGVNCPEVAKR